MITKPTLNIKLLIPCCIPTSDGQHIRGTTRHVSSASLRKHVIAALYHFVPTEPPFDVPTISCLSDCHDA
jgi:hypothetical protein